MSFILGVDTGGTYTDAVILEDEERVIAFSKALTTHSDLSLGIGSAIQKAVKQRNTAPEKISLVSLSIPPYNNLNVFCFDSSYEHSYHFAKCS